LFKVILELDYFQHAEPLPGRNWGGSFYAFMAEKN
jgi:hypothetical protein